MLTLDSLNIASAEDTPSINFNADTGLLELGHRSLPEDATEFYRHALEWMINYFKQRSGETILHIKLEYYNTTSAKQIFKMLSLLEEASVENDVKVRWSYMIGDEDMRFAGERFARLVSVPFEIIEVDDF